MSTLSIENNPEINMNFACVEKPNEIFFMSEITGFRSDSKIGLLSFRTEIIARLK